RAPRSASRRSVSLDVVVSYPGLAAALAAVDHVLGALLGGRGRRALCTRLGLDHRRLPALGDVLHVLVDQEAVGVALAMRRHQLPGPRDLDLIAALVGRAARLLGVLVIGLVRRRVADLLARQPLELDLVIGPRNLDDPQALLRRGIGRVADAELRPLALG